MPNGNQCPAGRIKKAATCQAAAKALGLTWKGTWEKQSDTPGCIYADDGRSAVFFNTALDATGKNSKYAEICKTAKGIKWAFHGVVGKGSCLNAYKQHPPLAAGKQGSSTDVHTCFQACAAHKRPCTGFDTRKGCLLYFEQAVASSKPWGGPAPVPSCYKVTSYELLGKGSCVNANKQHPPNSAVRQSSNDVATCFEACSKHERGCTGFDTRKGCLLYFDQPVADSKPWGGPAPVPSCYKVTGFGKAPKKQLRLLADSHFSAEENASALHYDAPFEESLNGTSSSEESMAGQEASLLEESIDNSASLEEASLPEDSSNDAVSLDESQ